MTGAALRRFGTGLSRRGARLTLLVAVTVSSSSCVMRYTHHDIDGTWYDDKLERGWVPPLELSLMTNDLPLGPSAFTLSLEAMNQDMTLAAVPPVQGWTSISMTSLMVGARFYPLARGPLIPYGAAGFGKTRLHAKWTEPEGGFDPLFRCIGACGPDELSGDIIGSYHPYLAGGVELRPPFLKPSFVFEYRRDFGRGDDFYQLSGTSVSAGLRFRW